MGLVLVVGPFLGLGLGCRGESSDAVVDRLWISELPRSARANFVAFALSSQKGRSFGLLHEGSVYRGSHRAFAWKQLAPGKFELQWLQEQRKARVVAEKCRPSAGFDHCVVMRGLGFGATRFQSRKRWRLRLKGDATSVGTANAGWLDPQLLGLAGEDR